MKKWTRKQVIKVINFITKYDSEVFSIFSVMLFLIFKKWMDKLNFLNIDGATYQGIITAILIILLNLSSEHLLKWLNKKISKVSVFFTCDKDENENFSNQCKVKFDNDFKYGFFYIKIFLEGNPEILIDSELRIEFPKDFALNKDSTKMESSLYEITSNQFGLIIKLSQLFNTNKTEPIRESKTIKINIYKENENQNGNVQVTLSDDTVVLENNKLILK